MPLAAPAPIRIRSGWRQWQAAVLISLLAISPIAVHAQGTGDVGPGPLPAVNYPHPVANAFPPPREQETIWIIDNGVSRPYYYTSGGWVAFDANRRPHGAPPKVVEAIVARQAAAGYQPGRFQSHALPNTARHPIVTVSHASRAAAEPPRRR